MMCGKTYTRVLASHRIRSSLSRPANCWDNAVTESFFSPLNLDLFCRHSWPTRAATVLSTPANVDYPHGSERRT